MNTKRKISLFVAWIALCVLLVCASVPASAAGEICTSEEVAAQLVREMIVNREAEIEIIYPIERAHLNEDEIMALVRCYATELLSAKVTQTCSTVWRMRPVWMHGLFRERAGDRIMRGIL